MDKKNKMQGLACMALLTSVALFPGNGRAEDNLLVPDVAPVAAVAQPVQAPVANIIPFEQPASQLELSGERDTALLSFALGDEASLKGGQIQLAYNNAVSVLPDTASVTVSVNGKPAGTFPIRSPNGVRVETLPVAAGLLKAGRNTVAITAVQHHRVDCSLDATYELWTRFSPEASGFVSASPVHFTKPSDLLAVGRNAEGFTEIRLVAEADAPAELVNQAVSTVQSLALTLNRRDILVTVGLGPGTGPGIDLYVGRSSQTGQVADAERVFATAPRGLSVADGSTPGRARVVLAAGSQKELDAALLAALTGPLAASLKSGILAPQPAFLKAEPRHAYSLATLGYQSQPFAGRLSRVKFDLDMPADFYPAEYDTMKFNLSGATAPGLMPNAQFLVRVNNRVVTSMPLRNPDGETFRQKRIELPLRAFRPGINRVELLAELPAPGDAACQPGERDDARPRFVMLDESTLEIPALARIGRLPDLGAFSGMAYPYASGKPFTVLVDQPGVAGLSTALTTLTRLSLAAARPLQATIAYGRPGAGLKGDVLVISTGNAASAIDNSQASVRMPEGVDAFTTGATGHADALFAAGSDALLDAFKQSTADGAERSVNTRFQDWLGQASDRFNSWLRYQDAAETLLPVGDDALVTISQRAAPSGDGVWTVIDAASPANLERGFHALAVPATWERLEGGAASVRADTLALVTHQAERRFVNEITDRSFGNARRLMASWFSDNFQIYVGMVVALMAAFGLWLGFAVKNSSKRADQ